MKPPYKEFDICFVCISDISSDARTINIARTLAKHGYNVCIIAPSDDATVLSFAKERIVIFKIPPLRAEKAWIRWMKFNGHANRFMPIAKAGIYYAADFYSLYAAKKFASKYYSKLFYDSREIFSAIGALHGNPMKQKIISKYERKWISHVDKIIVSGAMDADYLKSSLTDKLPYHVIMNLPPYRESSKTNLIREKYNIDADSLIIIYQGMLLEGRGIIKVIEALPHIDKAVFCIFGEGPYKEAVIKKVNASGLNDRVILHGRVPYDQLNDWTASADIGAVLNEPISLSYELALPNKLFEYCMARIPSLVSSLPAQKMILDEFMIGELISPEAGAEEIAEALKKLSRKENYVEEIEKAAQKYSYESQEDIILSLMNRN